MKISFPSPAMVVALVAAAAIGFVGTASADAPQTMDERVAALEDQVQVLSSRLVAAIDAQQSGDADLEESVARATHLARCIVAAEGVRMQWATVGGKRVHVIIDNLHDEVPRELLGGVEWFALVHPDCIRKPTRRSWRGVKEFTAIR